MGLLRDIIKEKIKANNEKAQSDSILDLYSQTAVEDAIKKGKTPEESKAIEKQFESAKKLNLKPDQAMTVMKALHPELVKDQLSPEEFGARMAASQQATYEGKQGTAERAFKLRTEFQAIPEVKDYQTIKNQVSSMDALLENVKTGNNESALALDQGLITLFNKITDPRSVVRESEYERTPQNISLANKFTGAFEKLKQGGAGITKQDREALVFGAKVIADSRGEIYNQTLSNYENLSNEFGVKPGLVTSGFGKAEKFIKNPSSDSGMVTIYSSTGKSKQVSLEEAKKMGVKGI